MVQLHRLEGFYWVARCRGYTRAAKAFPYPITQPGVYQQVRQLSTDLGGVILFERIAKDEVRLTPAGQVLFDFCAPFFEALPGVVRDIEAQAFGGELRIDGVGMTVRGLLPDWVRALRRKRPEIQVRLEEQTDPDPDRVRRGECDILVDFMPAIPDDLEARQVGTAYTFLVVPKEHRLAGRKRVTLDQMHSDPFVSYPPGTAHHGLQMAALRESGAEPSSQVSASSADSILAIVSAGLGYSLVPWLDPKGPKHRGLSAIRLRGKRGEFPIHAIWRKREFPNPLIQSALEVAPG